MSQQALIDKILKTAEKEAEELTDEMIGRAAENEKLTLKNAAAECAAIKKASDEKCAQIKRIAELTSGLNARKAKLHARREMLDEAFAAAYRKMKRADQSDRLDLIKKLIIKYAPSADMTVVVSERDLDAAVSEKAALEKALSDKFGKAAKLNFEKSEKLSGGVYMRSQLCDVDASLDAVFSDLREKYEAEADRLLFPAL